MDVGFVSEKYKESIKHILTYCFDAPDGAWDSFADEASQSENCLGAFDGDALAALLYINSNFAYRYRL